MPLSAGDKLGPYEILAPLGAGGMGEVYKARDTRLDRTVAVKVLPEHIAQREDLRARFEPEARAVASLNHPNICTLHDIGPGYMVMELIEGETLAARIEKGALPFDQALKLGTQIADALDRAHRAGVTHRDVKPQNIMLTRDGVKVLDFGLAKSAAAKPGPSEATLSAVLTTEGTVMGTPQYMAPEQFEGKEADARSDIWAFGAVLYEMVTGQKAFQGKSYSSLLYAIFSADPPPMSVKSSTPAWLGRLVRRCLAKDPEDRWQSMRDVVLELRTPPLESAAAGRSKTVWWPWIAVGLLAVGLGGLAFVHVLGKTAEAALSQLTFPAPEGGDFEDLPPSVSPDGKQVIFAGKGADGKRQLWLRRLDSAAAQPLGGAEDGIRPFWSPDSKSIGFFVGNVLKTMELAGGRPVTLVTPANNTGATWGKDGIIVFVVPGQGFKQIPAAGGTVRPVTGIDPHKQVRRFPFFLPDGRHFLYLAGNQSGGEQTKLFVGSLDGHPEDARVLVDPADSFAEYASGFLLFIRGTTLIARPFDARSLQFTGDEKPIAEAVKLSRQFNRYDFSTSSNGVIAYQSELANRTLTWYDPSGRRLGITGPPGLMNTVRLSPDGKAAIATARDSANSSDLWVYDLQRGVRRQFTSDPAEDIAPVWSPDGRTIVFASNRSGGIRNLYRKPADASRSEELLFADTNSKSPSSISPDGKYLVYDDDTGTGGELWILADPLGASTDRKAWKFMDKARRASETISPDGHWITYSSLESGRSEVYVAPFPSPGGTKQVSTGGGTQPRWRGDGRELFYLAPDDHLMVAALSASRGTLDVGKIEQLPTRAPYGYDVTSDGQRFLAIAPPEGQATAQMNVILNWTALLKK